MEFKMHLREKPFFMIKSGQKDIEMRLYDEKRQKIKVGDTIEFSNEETGQVITTEVVNLHVCDSFDKLYSIFDKKRLGYLQNEEADPKDMQQFYSLPEISKYGVVGIEVKLK